MAEAHQDDEFGAGPALYIDEDGTIKAQGYDDTSLPEDAPAVAAGILEVVRFHGGKFQRFDPVMFDEEMLHVVWEDI